MIKGTCLCGEVTFCFEASRIALFNNCYCDKCQRHSGSGFVSQLQVEKSGFSWLSGESLVSHFESSPGVFRAFCSQCGSRLPMAKQAHYIPVPAGTLIDAPDAQPEVNMHLSSKAPWALVDSSIHCLEDQGSEDFWASIMKSKRRDQ